MAKQNVTRQYFEVCGGFVDESGEWVTRRREITHLQHLRARDRMRTACQAPLSSNKLCVLYVVNRREKQSPWFYTPERAQQALALMQAKYGERNCILFRD
ncbi:hypothetical protein [Hydrogenophaga sp. H7]|uniref:hypothetical protein n=1 Tax=Hydrogenophaga sp. H7 TaxID=1882399 RepID=UPI0009A44005|nr:hypothetical protein [Hydrogenophaga sp. H7]OPF63884.1 hypothetical protein BC358_08280 [Hydrogenophaga sp. H7]